VSIYPYSKLIAARLENKFDQPMLASEDSDWQKL